MADLSALPESTIRSLEQALMLFGVEGVTVDGDVSDLDAAKAVEFLSKLSKTFGADGISFGRGQSITPEDFADPAKRAEILAQVQRSVDGFNNSPYLKLPIEILKGVNADYDVIKQQLGAIGIPNGAVDGIVDYIRLSLASSSPADAANGLIGMAQRFSPQLQEINNALGPQFLANIGQVIDSLENSGDWMTALQAIGEGVTSAQSSAPAQQAEPPAAAPDPPPSTDEPSRPTREEISTADATIEFGLKLLIPIVQGELDAKREEAQGLIDSIDGKSKPEDMQALYESRQALVERLNNLDPNHERYEETREALDARIQTLTRQMSSGSDGISNFIDGFLLGTIDSTLGRRMVQAGKNWAKGAINSRFANIHDIPDPGNLEDGVLDMQDQAALQGTLFLLATNYGIHLDDKWRYRPELGKLLTEAIGKGSFEDNEKLVLGVLRQMGGDAEIEAYEQMSQEDKVAFIKAKMAENMPFIEALVSALDTKYAAGTFYQQQLYFMEPVAIPAVTHEIFDDYLGQDGNSISVAQAGMLNGFVHQFTGGMGLASVFGDELTIPNDISNIDASRTTVENFTALYKDAFNDLGAVSAEDFRRKFDEEGMLAIIKTLPFGTEERRKAFEKAIDDAFIHVAAQEAAIRFQAAEQGKDEEWIVSQMGAAFGHSINESMEGINADPKMGADYLFMPDRPVQMHPDLAGKSFVDENGASISAEEVFAAYRHKNNDFKVPGSDRPLEGEDHSPIYFRDKDGQTYIAVIDLESRVFQVEPLNLEALQSVLDTQSRATPFEERYEALKAVSPGFDLAFQRGDWGSWSVKTSVGVWDFPRAVESHLHPLSYMRSVASAAPAPDAHEVAVSNDGVSSGFSRAAAGTQRAAEDASFRAEADQITTPAQGGAAISEPTVVAGLQQNQTGQ